MRSAISIAAIAALMLHASAAPTLRTGKSIATTPRQNDGRSPHKHVTTSQLKQSHDENDFPKHNVSILQQLAATHDDHNRRISLSDDQKAAILAADESPTHDVITDAEFEAKAYQNPDEKKHLAHIYKVLNADFTPEEIHGLFHSKDGKPLRLTDKEIDAAIAAHTSKPLKRRQINDDFPGALSPEAWRELWYDTYGAEFYGHNIPEKQHGAAFHDDHNKLIGLSDKKVKAIEAADESPTPVNSTEADRKPEVYQNPKEKQHLAHIYKVMNANFSHDDIHRLFHDRNDKPIRLTDQEVDAAISAHTADATKHDSKNKAILPRQVIPHHPVPASNMESGEQPTLEQRIYRHQYSELKYRHNISAIPRLAATRDSNNKIILLTASQMTAIAAANESPTRDPHEDRSSRDGQYRPADYQNPQEKAHVTHIYKAMYAGFSREEIYKLFHNKNGQPIRFTDREIDDAISARNAKKWKNGGKKWDHCLRGTDTPGTPEETRLNNQFMFLTCHNVPEGQILAATGKDMILSDAQLEAIAAADESSIPLPWREEHRSKARQAREKHRVAQIYRVLEAGFENGEIRRLFRDRAGRLKMVSDGEVEAAIKAHKGKKSV